MVGEVSRALRIAGSIRRPKFALPRPRRAPPAAAATPAPTGAWKRRLRSIFDKRAGRTLPPVKLTDAPWNTHARHCVHPGRAQSHADCRGAAPLLPVIVLVIRRHLTLVRGECVMPDLQLWPGACPASAWDTLTSAVHWVLLPHAGIRPADGGDRFAPQRVFLACSLLGALANAALLLADGSMGWLLALRFAVGFLLAGIYPVGMKIAASWYRERLGAVLGLLIGALVLGTALPHGLRALAGEGAAIVPCRRGDRCSVLRRWARPPGCWCRQSAPRARPHHTARAGAAMVRPAAACFGVRYFGHMLELYVFHRAVR